mgnify:CR=1 FL=1
MAKDKKSFLLYCDLIHTVSKMPNDKAGELFKHILLYVNDQNPANEDLIIQLTFEPIKQSLKRDLQKYENIRAKNVENANKRWNKNNATASDRMPNDTKNAVSDSDSDSDSDSVKEINNISLSLENDFTLFWNKYGKKNDSKKCKDKFLKLKKSEVDIILKVVDSYVGSTPDLQFRKNPLTWLNGKCWNDVEINEFLPTEGKPFGKTNQI